MIGKWSWMRLFWRFCSLLFSEQPKGGLLKVDSCFCWIPIECDLEVVCAQIDCFWWWVLFLFRKSRLNEIFLDFYFLFLLFSSGIQVAKLMVDYVLCWIFIGYDYRRSNVLQLVTSDCEWFLCCLDSWQFCVRLFIYLLHSSRWLLPFFFGLFVNLDFAITKINRIKWLSQLMKLNNI